MSCTNKHSSFGREIEVLGFFFPTSANEKLQYESFIFISYKLGFVYLIF